MTDRPPPPPRTKSGTHPAVGRYRDKLESIVDGEAEDLEALNRRLNKFLKESASPPPVIEDHASMTVGVARIAQPFIRGIDCLEPMANNTARQFKADGYAFVGRYLENLTLLERDWIFSAGLGLFLYTEATSGVLDAASGSARGIASVARARAMQAPSGLHILIDLESTGGDPTHVSDFGNTFHDELVSGGQDSIVYVGAGRPLSATQLYALKTHRYMRSGSLVPKPACGWCALQLSPLDQTIHGQLVDVVTIEADFRGRLPTLWWPN